MTGLEIIGLTSGALAIHEAEKKHGFVDRFLEALKSPFNHDMGIEDLILVVILIVSLVYIWNSILKGYITG